MANVVTTDGKELQVPELAPPGVGVAATHAPSVLVHTFNWRALARAELPDEMLKARVSAGTVVLVVVVVLVTVTLPVVVRSWFLKVYALDEKFVVVSERVAALAVLVTVAAAVQAA